MQQQNIESNTLQTEGDEGTLERRKNEDNTLSPSDPYHTHRLVDNTLSAQNQKEERLNGE